MQCDKYAYWVWFDKQYLATNLIEIKNAIIALYLYMPHNEDMHIFATYYFFLFF